MKSSSTIKSILANGGWCQLRHRHNTPIAEIVGGRFIYNNSEFALLERFDTKFVCLDGYYFIPGNSFSELEYSAWIKRMLTTSGKEVPEVKFPHSLKAENLNDFFSNMVSSREVLKLKHTEGVGVSRIIDFSNNRLEIESPGADSVPEQKMIEMKDIICLEFRSHSLSARSHR